MVENSAAKANCNRERILSAAAELVTQDGADALTTRAIAVAAGCQAPAIYRLFGDKQGLLEALAERALSDYVAGTRARTPLEDPVEELRSAWDEHVAFGLAHPAIYRLMTGANRPGQLSKAASSGISALRDRVRRVAAAGRLRVSEERGVALIHAAGMGTVLALLEMPEDARDTELPSLAREAVFDAVLTTRPATEATGTAELASAMRTHLDGACVLTPGERLLLGELLKRLAEA